MSASEVIRKGQGLGFIADGKIYLQRCFECGRENYALMVAKGICAWCGFDANASEQSQQVTDLDCENREFL